MRASVKLMPAAIVLVPVAALGLGTVQLTPFLTDSHFLTPD